MVPGGVGNHGFARLRSFTMVSASVTTQTSSYPFGYCADRKMKDGDKEEIGIYRVFNPDKIFKNILTVPLGGSVWFKRR